MTVLYKDLINNRKENQFDLDRLRERGETWGLRFNVSKNNMLHLARSRTTPTFLQFGRRDHQTSNRSQVPR